MPQTTELPLYRLNYPILAMTQKPGGVAIGTVLNTTTTWATGVATATCASAHGIPVGGQVMVSVTGVVPIAYNGFVVATATSTTAFTYSLTPNPGVVTTQGQMSWVPMPASSVPNPGAVAKAPAETHASTHAEAHAEEPEEEDEPKPRHAAHHDAKSKTHR